MLLAAAAVDGVLLLNQSVDSSQLSLASVSSIAFIAENVAKIIL